MSQVIPTVPHPRWAVAAALCAALVASASAQSNQPSSTGGIYTCTDAKGRRITSDRPIRECLDREQAELNSDGSTRRKLPPSMTPEERALFEDLQRRRLAEESARKDAVRLDRNLLQRYPSEAAHAKARELALATAQTALTTSKRRLADLERERVTLDNEAEFYKGKELPRQLKSQYDANQAATDAQRNLINNQQAEVKRLNAVYDDELSRLRKLWAGATPGSVTAPERAATGVR